MAYNPLQTFLQEADELIADVEQSALALSSSDDPAETINRLFRDFHTIKGSGAMCGLDALSGFTHNVENLLDRVRAGYTPVSEALIELILGASDHIKMLLDEARGGQSAPHEAGESLSARIRNLADIAPPAPAASNRGFDAVSREKNREQTWIIRFRPKPTFLANGGNPVALLRDLRSLGNCDVVAHTDEIPMLDDMQCDRCYLWWSVTLHSTCDRDAIRDVFLFVEEDGNLEIEEVECRPTPELTEANTTPGGQVTHAPRPAAPVDHPGAAPNRHTAEEATVRVPAERLNRLVNLVGEFVMNQSCLAQMVLQSGNPEFANPVQVLERLVAELRDNVLGIRMLPIGTLFGRFRRVVHDLSLELGKEAELVTEGAETELDKSILDQLGEPLVHCLRNCLDHGVEPAEDRVSKGKPRRATVRLSASHTGSSVVISVEDDGRGICKEAVRSKAIEKQLISAETSLTDKDILNLILTPGFSTAQQVTSVSGRGVGMDAIRRQIDTLRGALNIESREGQGTRVSITLPLTLAIIDGLLVQVGSEQFIFPMSSVIENVELSRGDRSLNNGRNLIPVRGELIPYVDLRETFGGHGEAPAVAKVVIVQHGNERVGLVVDRVFGSHQTVIQSLGKFYRNIEVVSGATIMWDGRVALIMDIAAVVRHVGRVGRTAGKATSRVCA